MSNHTINDLEYEDILLEGEEEAPHRIKKLSIRRHTNGMGFKQLGKNVKEEWEKLTAFRRSIKPE